MSSPIQLPQRTPASPSEPSSGGSWSQVDPQLDPVHFVVTLGGDATAACSTATEEAAMAEEAPQETRASMSATEHLVQLLTSCKEWASDMRHAPSRSCDLEVLICNGSLPVTFSCSRAILLSC